MEHELKTLPEYFQAVKRGEKTFELRRDDRPYAVGDTLLLREFDPDRWYAALAHVGPVRTGRDYAREVAKVDDAAYTGDSLRVLVTYVLRGGPWLTEGYVAMGVADSRQAAQRAVRAALDAREGVET